MNNTEELKIWASRESVSEMPHSDAAQEAFTDKFANLKRNFLTPFIEKYIETDLYFIEIASGIDAENDKTYGTTFLFKSNLQTDLQLTRNGFSGLNNALSHIVKVINGQ